ncbi:hypothetical protein [Microbacterium sp.]|uniref:hypothetical protein n=1 Tax=Microbacterium sp. TaxID=51671 RepID=UPI0039E61B90
MSTNSMTYADATGIRDDACHRLGLEYADALKIHARAVLDDLEDIAAYAWQKARRLAHAACKAGNIGPLIDMLEREIGVE